MYGQFSGFRKTILSSPGKVSNIHLKECNFLCELNQFFHEINQTNIFNFFNFRLYEEKISQIEKNLVLIRSEKSDDYLKHVERLRETMKTKEHVAEILKKFRLENISNLFKSEELAAAQNLNSEKVLLRDDIQDDLQDKIQRLEEDRNNIDIHTDMSLYSNGRRRKSRSQRKRAVAVSGPYIVYMLNEAEILEDWALIKKSLTTFKTEIL